LPNINFHNFLPFNNSATSSHRLYKSCIELWLQVNRVLFFFCSMLCCFLQSSCCPFNCSEFSSVDVAIIQLCCHVINLKFTLVRILLYVSLLEVIYCVSLGWNVQLNSSFEDSKRDSEEESPFFP